MQITATDHLFHISVTTPHSHRLHRLDEPVAGAHQAFVAVGLAELLVPTAVVETRHHLGCDSQPGQVFGHAEVVCVGVAGGLGQVLVTQHARRLLAAVLVRGAAAVADGRHFTARFDAVCALDGWGRGEDQLATGKR